MVNTTLLGIKETFVELGGLHAREDDPTKHRDDSWLWKRAQRTVRSRLRAIDTGALDIFQVQDSASGGYVEGWCCEQRLMSTVPRLRQQSHIWAIGYRDPAGVARLEQLETSDCTLFIDIRDLPLAPYQPQWSRKRLRQRFGRRYRHLRALGNVHYHDHGLPILLRDEEAGLRCLINWLQAGWDIVLICGCQDRERCHGTLVLRLLESCLSHNERIVCHTPRLPIASSQ